MRRALLLGALLLASTAVAAAAETVPPRMTEMINRSVVKIIVTYRQPNFYQPWQYKSPQTRIGSGFVVDGGKIVTNAHIVDDGVFIEVKKSNDPKKYRASVAIVGHQCDLALVTVDDPTFYDGVAPLPLGPLPQPLDAVSAFGFPQGGAEISITQGVVSRIEQTRYTHSGDTLLAVQIDAAINPGNSGGPVTKDGKVVGVAMQALVSGDNIGYIIPAPIVKHFLDDVADGVFDGFPAIGVEVELAESPALKSYYGLADGESGVLVKRVVYGSSADGALAVEDVITHIDGVCVADDGTVPLNDRLRVEGAYLTQKRQVGETMTVSFIRAKEKRRARLTLVREEALVEKRFDTPPRYLIYGGLVFTPLTVNLLQEWGPEWVKRSPPPWMSLARSGYRDGKRKEVVALRGVLAHRVNAGYHRLDNETVTAVNGRPIAAMDDLTEALAMGEGEYTVIETEEKTRIVIRHDEAVAAMPEILTRYGVPAAP
jgi:S1-C subfamily serine protease